MLRILVISMNYRCFITVFVFLSILGRASNAAAQPPLNFEIGVRTGVPFTDSLSGGTFSPFSSESFVKPGFTVGPTFGVVLRDQIAFEFDAIYTPIRFFGSSTTGPGGTSFSTTRGSSWEFPLLVNYRFFRRPIRPFGGGGIVLGSTLRGTTETRILNFQTGAQSLSTAPFRGSAEYLGGPALVFNGGLEWRNSRFLIRPELRYIRRGDPNQYTFQTFLFRTPDQFEYLIGFSFLGRSASGIR